MKLKLNNLQFLHGRTGIGNGQEYGLPLSTIREYIYNADAYTNNAMIYYLFIPPPDLKIALVLTELQSYRAMP